MIHAPAPRDEGSVFADHRLRHLPGDFDLQLASARGNHHELAARVGHVLLAEEPARADVRLATFVRAQALHALGLDVVTELEVRERHRRLARHHLRLERAPVLLDHAHLEHQALQALVLGELADRLFALQPDDFVLQHAARAVGMHPDRRVVEHARRGARHVQPFFFVGGDDLARLQPKRREVRARFHDVERAFAALKSSYEIASEHGFTRMRWLNACVLGFLDVLRFGAEQGGLDRMREALRYASDHGYVWDSINGQYFLAMAEQRLGSDAAARLALTQVRDLAQRHGHRRMSDDATLGLRALEQGDTIALPR